MRCTLETVHIVVSELGIRGDSCECSERKERKRCGESLSCYVVLKRMCRIIDGEGHSDKVLDGNEDCFVGNWGKGNLCYYVTRNLAELGLCLRLWKVELVSDETGYLAGEISKQCEQPA